MIVRGASSQKLSFCSLLAQDQGFDPCGTATPYAGYLVIEMPLPWSRDVLEAAELPEALVNLMRRRQKSNSRSMRPLFIAPDKSYSVPGFRRVLIFTRPAGALRQFERRDYLVPVVEVAELVTELLESSVHPVRFEQYRQGTDGVRDMLVCTHGSRDAACGKFGFSTYRHLRTRHAGAHLRVWRVSHIGGHLCAPTLLTFPDGRSWAFIDETNAGVLARRAGDLAHLYSAYRGWSALGDVFSQVVEREIFIRHKGWDWLDCDVQADILAAAADGSWGVVRISYQRPDGRRGAYEGRVDRHHSLDLITKTNGTETAVYPQYRVTAFTHYLDFVPECA